MQERPECKLLVSNWIWARKVFLTCWTTDNTLAWQFPGLNVPQCPLGVPKLAKLIILICHPCSQVNRTWELWDMNSKFGCQESAGGGSASDTCAHTSWPVRVNKEIFEGSPPSSSWRTSKFLPECTQVRGIWYLDMIHLFVFSWKIYTWEKKKNKTLIIMVTN